MAQNAQRLLRQRPRRTPGNLVRFSSDHFTHTKGTHTQSRRVSWRAPESPNSMWMHLQLAATPLYFARVLTPIFRSAPLRSTPWPCLPAGTIVMFHATSPLEQFQLRDGKPSASGLYSVTSLDRVENCDVPLYDLMVPFTSW